MFSTPGLAYALGLVGLTTITASLYVLLWATEPIAILLLAALVLREHIPTALAVSVAVAVLGVLLVVYQPGVAGAAVGITLTLVSVGCCALYTVLTRRLLLDDSSLTVVLVQQAAALGFAVVLATVVDIAGGPGWDLSGLGAADVAGSRCLGCPVLRARVLVLPDRAAAGPGVVRRRVPAAHPVFGLAGGYLVGERLEPRQWVGAVIVVVATPGIALQQRNIDPARTRVGQD